MLTKFPQKYTNLPLNIDQASPNQISAQKLTILPVLVVGGGAGDKYQVWCDYASPV